MFSHFLILGLLSQVVRTQPPCPTNFTTASWDNFPSCFLNYTAILLNPTINFKGAVLDCAGGRGLSVQGVVLLENFTMRNCFSSQGGAINAFAASSLTMRNAKFLQNRASTIGGAIYLLGPATLTCIDCYFRNCTAGAIGGAIGGEASAVVNLLRNSFTFCSAPRGGGGVLGATVVANFSQFLNCEASLDFGGAAIRSNTITVNNCSFDGMHTNRSSQFGGALNGWLTAANGCRFTDCVAYAGGAIYSRWIQLTDCLFQSCTAEAGGAVLTETRSQPPPDVAGTPDTYFTITRCSFAQCSATIGGALYLTSDLTLADSSFSACSATNAGAVYSMQYVNIQRTNFAACTAAALGGAMLLTRTVDATDLQFVGCTAAAGGAVNAAVANINDTKFIDCSSRGDGGALLTTNATLANCFFFNDSAAGFGGALSSSSVAVTGSTFELCSAPGSALFANSIDVDRCSFRSCTSRLNAGGLGWVPDALNQLVSVRCSRFESMQGGALNLYNLYGWAGAQLNISSCVFNNNSHPTGGSILNVTGAFTINFRGWAQSSNTAPLFLGTPSISNEQPEQNLSCSPSGPTLLSSSQELKLSTSGLSSAGTTDISPTVIPTTDDSPTSDSSAATPMNSASLTPTSTSLSSPLVPIQSTSSSSAPTVGVSSASVQLTMLNGYELTPGDQPLAFPGNVVFTGTLTVYVDGRQLVAGDTFTLFTFASSTGTFDELALSGTCLLTGRLEYRPADVLLVIESNTCLSTTGAGRLTVALR